MASEELAQVPRKGREPFMGAFTLQTVVLTIVLGALFQEVTNSLLVSAIAASMLGLLTHPVRDTEIGIRLYVLLRHVFYGRRRTVRLGTPTATPVAAPVVRVARKEQGWRYTP